MGREILIVNQVYVPDPAAVGQQMHDAALEMVRRGWQVQVLTAARGYDDPSVKYKRTEVIGGVKIRRFGLSSFGKASMRARLVAAFVFLGQAAIRGMFLPRVDLVLVSTVPPMCSIAGLLIALVRNVPLKFWVMDINPDQAVALGRVQRRSISVKLLDALNRIVLRRSADVIVLDRFMEGRLKKKEERANISVIPPWPHIDPLDEGLPHEENPFRTQQGLQDKFVVMYSGNISPCHPVTTILQAAKRLQDHERLVFLFIGGGLGMTEIAKYVRENDIRSIRTLPYQPVSLLRYSLSAADLHLVTMGNRMVGIVHPCKIYGAMAVARPVLFLGPKPSHISDILEKYDIGWQVAHGDVEKVAQVLECVMSMAPCQLKRIGSNAQEVVSKYFSRDYLRARLCNALER